MENFLAYKEIPLLSCDHFSCLLIDNICKQLGPRSSVSLDLDPNSLILCGISEGNFSKKIDKKHAKLPSWLGIKV